MKEILLIGLLIGLSILLFLYYSKNTEEGFMSGTDVQLLSSKPYYTWYDYLRNWGRRRYPVIKYPRYRHPIYNYRRHPIYNYGRHPIYNYERHPFYRARYY